MALSIKDEATDLLVRRYAALRKTSYTGAIKLAVSEALSRAGVANGSDDERSKRARDFLERALEVGRLVADAPDLDPRPYREILYDRDGLPR